MKIAVYTIAKNEEKFVQPWLESIKYADYIIVADTGSSDNTVSELKRLCPNIIIDIVTIKPWRFEDARNFSLNMVPPDADVCICLDMDEILTEGWRKVIEDNWKADTDRLRYNYVWSWTDTGEPGVTYYADKIHARHGLRWVNPVHEVLVKDIRLGAEKQVFVKNTLIEHYPDDTKSRSSYLPLLELSVKENPYNDRNVHYYGRELFFNNRYSEAIEYLMKHVNLPTATWASEKSASYRYIGDCWWALGEYDKAIENFNIAQELTPDEREPYVALAQAYRYFGNWAEVRRHCEAALSITEKPNSYICQPSAWGSWPVEMLEEAINNGA